MRASASCSWPAARVIESQVAVHASDEGTVRQMVHCDTAHRVMCAVIANDAVQIALQRLQRVVHHLDTDTNNTPSSVTPHGITEHHITSHEQTEGRHDAPLRHPPRSCSRCQRSRSPPSLRQPAASTTDDRPPSSRDDRSSPSDGHPPHRDVIPLAAHTIEGATVFTMRSSCTSAASRPSSDCCCVRRKSASTLSRSCSSDMS
jgi:hypothetical protein